MNLNLKLLADFYIGGILHALLKPPTVFLGKLLGRDHDIAANSTVTILKMLGGGSLVIAYPDLIAIKRLPQVRKLRLVASPAVRPFGEALGIFDEIVVIRDNSLFAMALDSVRAGVKLFRCDVIVDLEVHSRLTTVFCLLTCARNRVGFYTTISFWRRHLATHLLFYNLANPVHHVYDQIAALFGAQVPGLDRCAAEYRAHLSAPPPERTPGKLRLALAPSCSGLSRERMLLPEDWLLAIERKLAAERGPVALAIELLGGPPDREELERIGALVRERFPAATVTNHAGKTKLLESVRILAGCDGLLCIDSAMLHFGRLLGVPATSFWGPTDPHILLRPGAAGADEIHYQKLSCSPCVHLALSPPCNGDNVCMRFAMDPNRAGSRNPLWVMN
jgi:ADP-heptose:LPS heptosyltransferase